MNEDVGVARFSLEPAYFYFKLLCSRILLQVSRFLASFKSADVEFVEFSRRPHLLLGLSIDKEWVTVYQGRHPSTW